MDKTKTDRVTGTVKVLPSDYSSWSSTVIFFNNNFDDDEIHVYALNSDDCVVYHVVSYYRERFLHNRLRYIAGDFKVYFFGNVIYHEELDDYHPIDSLQVEVYDIPSRRWISDEFPKLKAPKPSPFVFFLDDRLYVLSGAMSPRHSGKHFEMLDIKNLSQGWVFLPEPSFNLHFVDTWGSRHLSIIDYSGKTLYIKLSEAEYDIYGYKLHDNTWHKSDRRLIGRSANLSKAFWSRSCVVVEKYLYNFQMLEHTDGQRFTLTIHDLEHDTDDEKIWEVDISNVVSPDVLHDYGLWGYLVYLGERNSCQRFSLIITYCGGAGSWHLITCTFDLRRIEENSTDQSFVVDSFCCCQYQHIEICHHLFPCITLCGVKGD